MRVSEWVSIVYFSGLPAVAWFRPLSTPRRVEITAIGAAACVALVAVARAGSPVARDWAPAAAILLAYYFSGRFLFQPTPAFESWLLAWDARLLGDPAGR